MAKKSASPKETKSKQPSTPTKKKSARRKSSASQPAKRSPKKKTTRKKKTSSSAKSKPAASPAKGTQTTSSRGGSGVSRKKAASKKRTSNVADNRGLSEFPDSGEKGSKKAKRFKPQVANTDIVYPEFAVALYSDDPALKEISTGPLTVPVAKEYLGWTEEKDGEDFGDVFLLKDIEGKKIRCLNNLCNRPFRIGQAKDLALEILRKKHVLTNESIGIDRLGMVKDGQHTMIGLVLAEMMRNKQRDKWKSFWNTPCYINRIVVTGMSESKEVANVLGTGMRRTAPDSLFCMYEDLPFGNDAEFYQKLSYKNRTKITKVLGFATRLCWLRAGGKTVSFAPKFPHTELFEFIEAHPRLLECCRVIWELECLRDRKLSSFISLGYAAALLYLMASSGTDVDKNPDGDPYSETRDEADLNWDMWDKACDFWHDLAEQEKAVMPIRRLVLKIDASGGLARDEICGIVVKGWAHFVDGKTLTEKNCSVKKIEDEHEKLVLAETPRIGGIDVEAE